ncbi:MAG TPA: SpoIIE family protein phosphatase, partial [Bacteroidia bacterium]
DGVWNENGASLIIEISPPFYKTKWFLAMCGIMGLAGAWNYVRMREKKLKAEKKILEQKVEERTVELRIEKEKVVAAHQDIKDSINYARRIQSTILPGEKEWKSILPDSFVLYKPRDIVSGDFFWLLKEKDLVLVAAADCTGHGVPGAFMSMIGHTQLNDIVKQEGITDTAAILDRLHVKVSAAMKQDAGSGARDGMDIALVAFDPIKMMLHYSGANRPLLLVRGGEIKEFKADKFPIGGGSDTGVRNFSSNRIELCKGDIIYLFSDGFGDQFGGPKGKKFGTKQLREILLEISAISISRQKETLEDRFNAWKRDVEQVDDVLVIGFRV